MAVCKHIELFNVMEGGGGSLSRPCLQVLSPLFGVFISSPRCDPALSCYSIVRVSI